jgi:hypothetical protein
MKTSVPVKFRKLSARQRLASGQESQRYTARLRRWTLRNRSEAPGLGLAGGQHEQCAQANSVWLLLAGPRLWGEPVATPAGHLAMPHELFSLAVIGNPKETSLVKHLVGHLAYAPLQTHVPR